MRKGPLKREEQDRRHLDAEKLLIRRGYVGAVAELCKIYPIEERTAKRYLAKVREKWRETSSIATVEDMRDEVRAQIEAVAAAAWNKTAIVKNKDGTVVVDQDPNSATFGKPMVKAEADTKTVLRTISHRRALDGLDKPVMQHVKLDSDVTAMPDIAALPDAVADKLRKELTALAPDGDLRKLAGEWFKQETEDEKP